MIFLILLSSLSYCILYFTAPAPFAIPLPTPPITEVRIAPSPANFNLLVSSLTASSLPKVSCVSLLVMPPNSSPKVPISGSENTKSAKPPPPRPAPKT